MRRTLILLLLALLPVMLVSTGLAGDDVGRQAAPPGDVPDVDLLDLAQFTALDQFRVMAWPVETDDSHGAVRGAQAVLFAFVLINGQ